MTVSWSGGTPTYTVSLYSGLSLSCASDTTLVGTTPGLSGVSTTFPLSPTSPTYYCATVTDSATTPMAAISSADHVTVNPVFSVGATTPVSPSIDSGQSITMTAHPVGGTGRNVYQWYSGASCTTPISGATLLTYSASPTSNSTYYVLVTDSSAVDPHLSVPQGMQSLSCLPSVRGRPLPRAPTVVSGRNVNLSVTPTGGTSPYTYQWYTGPSCNTPLSGATGPTYPASPSSDVNYSAMVTDSSASGGVSSCSLGSLVTVSSNSTLSPVRSLRLLRLSIAARC